MARGVVLAVRSQSDFCRFRSKNKKEAQLLRVLLHGVVSAVLLERIIMESCRKFLHDNGS